VVSGVEKSDLLRITSYIVWPALIAPVFSPLAGGLLTTYASWHWIFLINVPLGAVAIAVAWRLVPRVAGGRETPPPLDWPGMLLTCAGLGGLTYAAHLVSSAGAPAAQTALFAAGSAAALAAAVWHLRRAPHPLLNLATLRVHTFRVSQLGMVLYGLVVGAGPFLLPLLWQTEFGWSPVKSGSVVLFIFVGNIGVKPATTPLIRRFGFRTVLAVTTLLMAAVMAALGFTTAATPLPVIAALTLLSGITRSIAMTVYNTVGFADMPAGQMRDANTLFSTAGQLASGLAVAVATVALRAGTLLPGASAGQDAAGAARAAGHGTLPYTFAFVLLAVIAAVASGQALRLSPEAGAAARGARTASVPAPES
jgi:hypothetical protein